MKQYIFSIETVKLATFSTDECGVDHAIIDMGDEDKPFLDHLGQGDEIVVLTAGKATFKGTITLMQADKMRVWAVKKK